MRYKFRGKRVDNGEWIYGNLIEDDNGNMFIVKEGVISPCILPSMYLDEVYEVIPETVGQWTGFLDENDEEVYEGDIVRYDEKFMAVIVWKEGGFVFKYMDGVENISSSSWYDPLDRKITEVIGNIHDNPELLKGGNLD